MTAILGISAYYHDSAAALVVDGEIVAAAQEERFSRKKHDERFPARAIEYCLHEAGLTAGDLDLVGFYEKPFLKFDRLLETYLAYAPVGFRSFAKAMPIWLKDKLFTRKAIRDGVGPEYRRRIVFVQHHESHAASAFFPSPFDEAAILTIDGVGEWTTAALGVGRADRIDLLRELRFPHSLGMLYSAFTYFAGFKVNSGEYKLMGLAPYGEPRFADAIREHLLALRPDGSFRLNMAHFNYCAGLTMTSRRFHALFGAAPRKPGEAIRQLDMDLAASVQVVTEEIVLRMAAHVHDLTGSKNLCLAGGVALNCVANGRLLAEGPFEKLWIQPAAGDAGGSLGTALMIWHQLLGNERTGSSRDRQHGSYLGPSYTTAQVRSQLEAAGAVYQQIADERQLLTMVAGELANGRVVGWLQGRMEFGPRALGARSILGDPRDTAMQSTMNRKIKFRESFRPFAPSVLRDQASDWFAVPADYESPYMLLVAPVHERHRTPIDDDRELTGLERLQHPRSRIPAVTHVDYSSRIQTVDGLDNSRYAALLEHFFQETGCPVLVNTSFNVRGEPIVCTPEDAYRCFMGTNIDVLVIEDFVLHKTEQPHAAEHVIDEHVARFDLD